MLFHITTAAFSVVEGEEADETGADGQPTSPGTGANADLLALDDASAPDWLRQIDRDKMAAPPDPAAVGMGSILPTTSAAPSLPASAQVTPTGSPDRHRSGTASAASTFAGVGGDETGAAPQSTRLNRGGSTSRRRRASFSGGQIPFEPLAMVTTAAVVVNSSMVEAQSADAGSAGPSAALHATGAGAQGGATRLGTEDPLEDVDESIAVERALQTAAEKHLLRHLRQLLAAQGLDHERWCPVIISLVSKLQASVRPNVRRGDSMDIREYVKIRCLTGGELFDCSYHSGVVFTKNVA